MAQTNALTHGTELESEVIGGECCDEVSSKQNLNFTTVSQTRTRVMIGSTTKALTTFMMAKLVDAGLFEWDTPVRDVLPSFALAAAKGCNCCSKGARAVGKTTISLWAKAENCCPEPARVDESQ